MGGGVGLAVCSYGDGDGNWQKCIFSMLSFVYICSYKLVNVDVPFLWYYSNKTIAAACVCHICIPMYPYAHEIFEKRGENRNCNRVVYLLDPISD